MGLDMYLKRGKKIPRKNFKDYLEIENKIAEGDKEVIKKYKKYIKTEGEFITWQTLFEECTYWRKANAIHKWFVYNVQKGVDNCEYYEVSKEQIKQLLDICKEIIKNTQTKKGKIKNDEILVNGKWVPQYTKGIINLTPEVAKSLLPTYDGFFFGSQEYDEYYLDDIKYTIKEFEAILKYFDFDNNYLVYISSW